MTTQEMIGQEFCPGYQGDKECHPCDCGDHGCCNPGLTPLEAFQAERELGAN